MIYILAVSIVANSLLVGFLVMCWRRDRQAERDRLDAANSAHRADVQAIHERHLAELRQLHMSHREEIAALNQARIEETANLLQRIQAPEQATVTHASQQAPPDPLPVSLESDEDMLRLREERMREMGLIADEAPSG